MGVLEWSVNGLALKKFWQSKELKIESMLQTSKNIIKWKFIRNSPNYSLDMYENYDQGKVDKLVMPILKHTHLQFIQHVENYRKIKIKVP